MADITSTATPSYASQLIPANDKDSGLKVGEDIPQGCPCVIYSDGLVYQSDGTGTTRNKIHGFAAGPAYVAQGDTITLIRDSMWGFTGSGLNPGAPLYLSGATKGTLASATSTNVTKSCGYIVDGGRARLKATEPS
jgi:hypothetical protein